MKSIMLGGIGSIYFIASVTNFLDYDTNFQWIKQILTMQNTVQNPAITSRAIHADFIHHMVYKMVLLWELVMGLLCLGTGLLSLWNYKKPILFNKIISVGTWGVFGAFLFHGYVYYAVANEWFAAWQATTMGTKVASLPFVVLTGITLILLKLPDSQREDETFSASSKNL